MRASNLLRTLAVFGLTAVIGFGVGCSDDNPSNTITDPGQLNTSGVVLLLHDAPIDGLSEVWLTVTSIRLLTSDDTTEVDDDSTEAGMDTSGVLTLDQPIRMNLLALDSISRVLAVAAVPAGSYSKLRLYVSDPLIVLEDSTEVASDEIKLVANGKVDLNPQGDVIVTTDAFTVVSLDLDAEKSIQVNQTGNDKYILHPQVFVDATVDSLESVEVIDAEIVTYDAANARLTVDVPGSGEILTVDLNPQTVVYDSQGLILVVEDLAPGQMIDVLGALDTKQTRVLAQQISMSQ